MLVILLLNELLDAIIENISKVIVGKKNVIELVLTALMAKGHILIEDVPGVGKTSLVSALARSIDCSFRRIQFTPDILPSDITGFSVYNQKTGCFEYREGLVFSSFILADEINRASPKTQSSLLEVMEEGQVTVDGVSRKFSAPFMVLATQNPVEYLGTYPLPEAQMDRFLMRISLGYPELSDEAEMLRRCRENVPLDTISSVASSEDVVNIQNAVRRVYIHDSLYYYIVNLLRASRKHSDVELGVSPRGGLALMRAGQAWAFYKRRGFLIPDDIKAMAAYVLSHRMILRQEARLRGVKPESIVQEILMNADIPQISEYGC